MTCDICGTGFASKEDILIHGCYICCNGFPANKNRTKKLKITKSKYCSPALRRKLYIKHNIPLELAELPLNGTISAKNAIVR